MTNNQFQESLIPKFVWDFVKKVIKNPITAGILALIIWNYIKNKDLKKGVKKESVEDFFTEEEFNNLIDSLYSEDNTMDNSGDVLTTVIPDEKKKKKKDEEDEEEFFDKLNNVRESITIPIEIGDTILGGKFKNKRIVVKDISTNERGEPLINGKPIMKYRLIKKDEEVKK